MKRFLSFVLLFSLLCTCSAFAVAEDSADAPAYDGYIVKLRDDYMMTLDAEASGAALGMGMYQVDSVEAAYALAGASAVQYVIPNYRLRLFDGDTDPALEPYYEQQWYLNGTYGLNAAAAWSQGIDGTGVTVAVLDTGLFSAHEDFSNTHIPFGVNAPAVYVGDDDDPDNDALHGDLYDYSDVAWHGTAVTGVIAASVNSYGIVGAAHKATILPIRVFDENKAGYIAYLFYGIYCAILCEADVINMSLGVLESDIDAEYRAETIQAFQDMIDSATKQGILVVASAGNDGNTSLSYPAACDGVISVGATTVSGTVASYSQRNQSVWVTAPGSDILTTYASAGSYLRPNGTSFSSPCVAALAALAKQYANEQQQSLTPAEFADLLRLTAIDAGDAGYDYCYGYGYVTADSLLAGMQRRSVTYNLNGGHWDQSSEEPETVYVPYSAETVELTDQIPQKENYFFGGWYKDPDCTGTKVLAFTPTDSLSDRTYYAKWIPNVTELAAVSLAGYPAEKVSDSPNTWIAYLPCGTAIPTDTDCVALSYAYSGTDYTLGSQITKSDDGWVIGMTQNTSDDIYEDTYYLIADNTTYHAPERRIDAVEGTATPMSLDGVTDPVLFTADLSAWFCDEDDEALSFSVCENERLADGIVGLEIVDGLLIYKPPVAVAGTDICFSVTASDARFIGDSVSVTVHVDGLPLSVPTVQQPGEFDAIAPTELQVGFTAFDNTLCAVCVDGSVLTEETDYTVFNGETIDGDPSVQTGELQYPTYVELRQTYLETLANGTHSVTLRFARDVTQDVSTELTVVHSCVGGHCWDDGILLLSSGCTSYGRATYSCEYCGEVITVALATLGHSYADGVCTRCGAAEPVSDDPTGDAAEGLLTQETRTLTDGRTVTRSVSTEGDIALAVYEADGTAVAELALPSAPDDGKSFVDVAQAAWYHSAVSEVTALGLFHGTSESTFSPDTAMTRGMLLTVLYNFCGSPDYGTEQNAFTDVGGQWYANAVNWGYRSGITSGSGGGSFLPEQEITREQLITMLYRFVQLFGIAPDARAALDSFSDGERVSAYAADALQWAVAEQLLSGRIVDGALCLAPQGTATRAETAAVMSRFVQMIKG